MEHLPKRAMAMMEQRKLNPKQLAFVAEYLIDFNGTQAAIRAGYSKHTANEQAAQLLAKLSIQAEIAKLMTERKKQNEVTVEWIRESLKTVATRCMQGEPVMQFDREEKRMVPTGEWEFDSSGANKSLELLGKHIGMFIEKIQHTGKDGEPIEHKHTHAFDDVAADLITKVRGCG